MAEITDLSLDILSYIMLLAAQSSDGATTLATARTICKLFLEASNSTAILQAMCFVNLSVFDRYHLFQKTNGLLYDCAAAGNISAQYVLAQVILATSTQLARVGIRRPRLNYYQNYSPKYKNGRVKDRGIALVASFFAHFTPRYGSNSAGSPQPFMFHWDLVKLFLSRCTTPDICNMNQHLRNYVQYFLGRVLRGTDTHLFIHYTNVMYGIAMQKENTWLVRLWSNYYVRVVRGAFPPALYLPVPDPYVALIDWRFAAPIFQEVQVRALDVFDRMILAFM